MAKAASGSQASTMVPRGGRSTTNGPPTGTGGSQLRRRTTSSRATGKLSQGLMNFYTDDSPGLKISPVVVIVMSLGFIFFVTVLHIVGKIRGV